MYQTSRQLNSESFSNLVTNNKIKILQLEDEFNFRSTHKRNIQKKYYYTIYGKRARILQSVNRKTKIEFIKDIRIEWKKKELTTENKDELKKNNLHSTLC